MEENLLSCVAGESAVESDASFRTDHKASLNGSDCHTRHSVYGRKTALHKGPAFPVAKWDRMRQSTHGPSSERIPRRRATIERLLSGDEVVTIEDWAHLTPKSVQVDGQSGRQL